MKRAYLLGKLSGLAMLSAAVALTASAVRKLLQAQCEAIAAQQTEDDPEETDAYNQRSCSN